MAKIDVITIIEYASETIQGTKLFPVFDKAKKSDVVYAAENDFISKEKQNGMEDNEVTDSLDDGLYENGDYQVFLYWSEMELES